MTRSRLVLASTLLAALTGCAPTGRSSSAVTSDQGKLTPPVDIGAIATRARLAFAPRGGNLVGGNYIYGVSASPKGAISFQPVSFPKGSQRKLRDLLKQATRGEP